MHRQDYRLWDFIVDFIANNSYCVVPGYKETQPTACERIVRSQSPDISLVCLCLALCLFPCHLTRALNCTCLFHLDAFGDKIKVGIGGKLCLTLFQRHKCNY